MTVPSPRSAAEPLFIVRSHSNNGSPSPSASYTSLKHPRAQKRVQHAPLLCILFCIGPSSRHLVQHVKLVATCPPLPFRFFVQCALYTPLLYLILQRVDLVIHFPYRWRRVLFYITLNIPDLLASHTFATLYSQFAVYFRCMDVLWAFLAGAGHCAV